MVYKDQQYDTSEDGKGHGLPHFQGVVRGIRSHVFSMVHPTSIVVKQVVQVVNKKGPKILSPQEIIGAITKLFKPPKKKKKNKKK
jgi:hypothetical protein